MARKSDRGKTGSGSRKGTGTKSRAGGADVAKGAAGGGGRQEGGEAGAQGGGEAGAGVPARRGAVRPEGEVPRPPARERAAGALHHVPDRWPGEVSVGPSRRGRRGESAGPGR